MKGAGETAGKFGSFIAKEEGELAKKLTKKKYTVRSEDEEIGGYDTQIESTQELNEGDTIKLPGEDKTSVVVKKGW